MSGEHDKDVALANEINRLLESLNDVYHDVLFMVERKIIPDIMMDAIYERAEKILQKYGKL